MLFLYLSFKYDLSMFLSEVRLDNIKMHTIWTLFFMQHNPHELFFNSAASKMLLDFKLRNISEHCQKGQTSLTLRRDKHLTHFIVYLASCSSISDRVSACDICFNCCELASGWGTHVWGPFEEMPSTVVHEVWQAFFFFLTANRDSLKC